MDAAKIEAMERVGEVLTDQVLERRGDPLPAVLTNADRVYEEMRQRCISWSSPLQYVRAVLTIAAELARADRVVLPRQPSIDRLMRAGAALATCAFNLSQRPNERIQQDVCDSLDACRKEWDAARHEHHASIAKGLQP